MVTIPASSYERPTNPRYRAWAVIKCPGCGVPSTLSRQVHDVDAGGRVTPSYVCPHSPCTFHDWVILEGWSKP